MEESEDPLKMGIDSTGQMKNPALKMNFSDKMFSDETQLMNQETIKNLESFRKLTIAKDEDFSEKSITDEELMVKLSTQSEDIGNRSSSVK